MSINWSILKQKNRLLFEIPLKTRQGQRFQPTGFPNLGAATFKTSRGEHLLVESTQSMANRLEMTIWDAQNSDVIPQVLGISHVRVMRHGRFFTDSMIEAHRLNSPYILEGSDKTLENAIQKEMNTEDGGMVDRKKFAEVLLKYDIGSLLHGVFIAKTLAGGRLRIARAISAFIEADGVRVAPSGGVKIDAVNPSGDATKGFGNVPFSRDEYTAERIILYVNIDLAQMRGYGLGDAVYQLLVLLSLYKLRRLVDSDLRLRTACDFVVAESQIKAENLPDFYLPDVETLEKELKAAISEVRARMVVTEMQYNDNVSKSKEKSEQDDEGGVEV